MSTINNEVKFFQRYEHRTSLVLTIATMLFLVVYAVPVIHPSLPPYVVMTCSVLNIVLWIIFALDLGIRTVFSGQGWRYLSSHPLGVIMVVLPLLRPLRILRVLGAARHLFSQGGLAGGMKAVALSTSLLVFVGAVAELDAERDAPGANISIFSDALWWAISTVTTVGYGDYYPITLQGRLIAVGLMLVGVSLIGILTAAVASWFVSMQKSSEQVQD